MSLEQAIHQRWAAAPELAALLPAARVSTGTTMRDTARPYGILQRVGTAKQLHTSSGTQLEDVRVQLVVWTDDLDSGKQILGAVDAAFHRSSFATPTGMVRHMRRIDLTEQVQPDMCWKLAADFLALVEINAG